MLVLPTFGFTSYGHYGHYKQIHEHSICDAYSRLVGILDACTVRELNYQRLAHINILKLRKKAFLVVSVASLTIYLQNINFLRNSVSPI